MTEAGRTCLTVHPKDNVTTLLDQRVDIAHLSTGQEITGGIPFGHKAALRDIPAGAAVVKYGVVIGHASSDIPAGAHVHVHNVD